MARTLLQEAAAFAAGVPTPLVRRTVEGDVFAAVDGGQARVYGWEDLKPPDPLLDPGLVGSVVAATHQVSLPLSRAERSPVPAWYVDPVGARRWHELAEQPREAGAPFAARLAALREDLVALESWLESPRAAPDFLRGLWADSLLATAHGGLCVIDWESSGPADPSQELACALFEFGRTDPGRACAIADACQAAGGPGT